MVCCTWTEANWYGTHWLMSIVTNFFFDRLSNISVGRVTATPAPNKPPRKLQPPRSFDAVVNVFASFPATALPASQIQFASIDNLSKDVGFCGNVPILWYGKQHSNPRKFIDRYAFYRYIGQPRGTHHIVIKIYPCISRSWVVS